MNKWTVGLAAAGVVSLASTAQAEENSVLTSLSSTVLSGSVEASYVGGFSQDNNLYDSGQFRAMGASLGVSSPLGGDSYSAGFNVETLIGQRADDFGGGDFHLKNANIGMNLPVGNGVDLTLGLFDTIVGYEVEASASNPNVMRSYGYAIEPFTHTGLLASTSLNDMISVTAGLLNGFDNTGDLHNGDNSGDDSDSAAQLGYALGLELTAPDSVGFLAGASLAIGYVNGNDDGDVVKHGYDSFGHRYFTTMVDSVDEEGNTVEVPTPAEEAREANQDDNSLFYVGLSVDTPIEGLSLGLAYDDRQFGNGNEADAFAVYGVYSVSDSLSIAARYDSVTYDIDQHDPVKRYQEDSADMLTLTLNYSIWENLTTRAELGWENGLGEVAGGEVFGDRDNAKAGAGSSSYFALNAFYAF